MWGKFFLYASVPEKNEFIQELIKINGGIKMAFTVLKNISQDELNWYHESRYWMHVSDELTMKNAATREGLKQGLELGKKQGTEDAKIETAKNLLKMKLCSNEQIAQATGLSLSQVQSLAAQQE